MPRQLPSLNALRAFEAAARRLSFTRAADELFVTQAAVSHQIKHLEEQLGMQLFRRMNRQLQLTDAGQILMPFMSDALDMMASGIERLNHEQREGRLTVSTLESIAASWLVPRLRNFRAQHPEIELSLEIADHPVDFDRDKADMAIRYGPGGWPGVSATKIADEEIFPVLSPSLLEKGPPLKHPRDLLKFPLIHEDMVDRWEDWFEAVGETAIEVPRGSSFPHSNLVMQAVMAGEGVALGRSFLIGPEIASGRLVRPFAASVTAAFSFYVVAPSWAQETPKVQAFTNWIVEETRVAVRTGDS